MNLNHFPSTIFFFPYFQPKNRVSSPKTTQVVDPPGDPLGILVISDSLYFKYVERKQSFGQVYEANPFVCTYLDATPLFGHIYGDSTSVKP
jgi:hypothetical protein